MEQTTKEETLQDSRHTKLAKCDINLTSDCRLSTDSGNKANNNNSHNDTEQNNNRTTDGQTMMHILKANIGTGVLAMPGAFKNVGLWLGFIMVPMIGAICIHCMNILIESHNHLCDRFNYESLDYDQVAALGLACGPKFARRLAKKAHIIVTIFLIFTQIGFCCVYIMFVVENIQLAMLNLFAIQYSTTTYLLLVFPIIGLTSCTSNLKHLARISTFANILQLLGLALIFFDLLQFHVYSQRYEIRNTQPIEANSTLDQRTTSIKVNQLISDDIWAGLPLFFATAVYAFEGIGVVLPVIKEMRNPAHISGLNGVLNSSMALVAILYMAMGFFGYGKYGQFVQGSITLNLPETTLNEIVRLTFAIAIGLSYSLQFYVPWTIIWPFIDESLFYSYRPRPSRDKLRILNKLSAENKWDIDEYLQSSNMACSEATGAGEQQNQHAIETNSNASTFATSYTNTSIWLNAGVATQVKQSRKLQLNLSSSLTNTINLNQYGSMSSTGSQVFAKPAPVCMARKRNRLEDVTEQDEEDSMPEVEWRPPPRSMRGKRKLVRYTVILVTVSFTFVAAALIPRLDLFISLIGALASSSLAIIFPAIIQTCTFWSKGSTMSDEADAQSSENSNTRGSGFFWSLFVVKNLLLILFGIAGLVTGSWISISQLSAIYINPNTAV